MNKRFYSKFVLLTLAVSTSRLCAIAGSEKPNIVYIMADELACYELPCMGHPLLPLARSLGQVGNSPREQKKKTAG